MYHVCMRTLLGVAVLTLLAASSCGGFIVASPGPSAPGYSESAYRAPAYASGYGTGTLYSSSAATLATDTPEVRLPYVTALRVPFSVYADERFTLEFDISADAAPQLLIERALPPLELQVGLEPSAQYAGQLSAGPWLLAEPADPLVPGEPDAALRTVSLGMKLHRPGTYLLVWEGADRPDRGGRPARYIQNGVEFTRGEVSIKRTTLQLTVLPSRNILQPRFYNEPDAAQLASGNTWDYWDSRDWDTAFYR
jgi:hypothetical protein